MTTEKIGSALSFQSEREDPRGHPVALSVRYEPEGEKRTSSPGSLEAFLTERYCLYTIRRKGDVLARISTTRLGGSAKLRSSSLRPTHQRLARALQPSTVDQIGQGRGCLLKRQPRRSAVVRYEG